MNKTYIQWIVLVTILLSVGCRNGNEPAETAAADAAALPTFEDVTEQAGITAQHTAVWSGMGFTEGASEGGESYLGAGQAWGDYDNDGWLDLYVTGGLTENVLYHNEQDGTFSVSPYAAAVAMPGAVSGGVGWGDYDNDGWLDLYVLVKGANVLFHNENGAGFRDVTATAGVGDERNSQSGAWGDYDNDGYLDLYVVNWSCVPDCDPVDFATHQDVLYHNNGNGTFTDVSNLLVYEKLLGAGFAASFVDYDNDRDLDIYVINDEFQNPIGNVLFRNDGPVVGAGAMRRPKVGQMWFLAGWALPWATMTMI